MAELLIRNSSVGFIKSIIFDKDGTLSNSEECLLELARTRIEFAEKKFKKLKINNIKILLLRKLLVSVYGLRGNSLLANSSLAIASREQNIISTATILTLFGFDWFNSLSLSQEIFNEVDIFLSNKKDHMVKQRTLVLGALDLLVSLKNKGVCIALMSNDTKAGIEEFICRNKLEGIFDYLWSAENKPSKPAPEAVIELCKNINFNPSECALISDADTDLKMAKEADIAIVIGFTGGWKKPPKLTEKQFKIKKFNELKIQRNT
ncbi:HAD family hydrolase [Prochlorococcus marinus]|uniref:HAD family hydrolase n=1 Tax=Prochlorococcus marinus XMU1408 TaxID=2213228 RepID=A0A318REY5_PROMR|nr:HAD-IA family hydrolase [Prochlorococcus marinus]MBW3041379.1 HAD family hydrolase [Prochlorococcus marinus str. XMU1408]PYE02543.1 HAD family hydrolase [Prochlorococcus marinus XMU1408]